MSKPWVKLWRKEEGRFARLPLLARGLHAELLKAADDEGRVYLAPGPVHLAIARLLGAEPSERRALKKLAAVLIASGYLVHEEAGCVLVFPTYQARQSPTPTRPKKSASTTGEELEDDTSATGGRPEDDTSATLARHKGEAKSPESLETGNAHKKKRRKEGEEKKIPPPDPLKGDVRELFDLWRGLHGKDGRTKLDAKRRGLLKRALKSHGRETVEAALRGHALSLFHRERYWDLRYALRDAATIEKWAEPPAETGGDLTGGAQTRETAASLFAGWEASA